MIPHSASEDSRKKRQAMLFLAQVMAILVVVGTAVGAKIYAQNSAEQMTKSSTQLNWNAARGDLTKQMRNELTAAFGQLKIPEPAMAALIACQVDEQINWLNRSGCSYDATAKSEAIASSIGNSSACLEQSGGRVKLKSMDIACIKAHIPNDWAMYQPMFAKAFASALVDKQASPELAEIAGECTSHKYIQALAATGCKPLNEAATSADGLIGDQGCIEQQQQSLDQQLETFSEECMAVAH